MTDYNVTRSAANKVTERFSNMLRNLQDDYEDDIVVVSLMKSYEMSRHPDKIDHADEWIDPDYDLLTAIERVLEYYMNKHDFNAWMLNRDYPKR